MAPAEDSFHPFLLVLGRLGFLIPCVLTTENLGRALVEAHIRHVIHRRRSVQCLDLVYLDFRHLRPHALLSNPSNTSMHVTFARSFVYQLQS